ncbi:hypothetical protein L9F63_026830, partial [Diploptera punctata]
GKASHSGFRVVEISVSTIFITNVTVVHTKSNRESVSGRTGRCGEHNSFEVTNYSFFPEKKIVFSFPVCRYSNKTLAEFFKELIEFSYIYTLCINYYKAKARNVAVTSYKPTPPKLGFFCLYLLV